MQLAEGGEFTPVHLCIFFAFWGRSSLRFLCVLPRRAGTLLPLSGVPSGWSLSLCFRCVCPCRAFRRRGRSSLYPRCIPHCIFTAFAPVLHCVLTAFCVFGGVFGAFSRLLCIGRVKWSGGGRSGVKSPVFACCLQGAFRGRFLLRFFCVSSAFRSECPFCPAAGVVWGRRLSGAF